MKKNKTIELVLTQISLLFMSIFVLFPFIWMTLTSFKDRREIYTNPVKWLPEKLTFQHYYDLISLHFERYFFNSIFVAVIAVGFVVIISALASYGFSRFRFIGCDALYSSCLMGTLLPVSVMLLPIYVMMGKANIIDTFTSLIIVCVALRLPFSVWVLTGYFRSIPQELDAAARIDGCNRLQTLFHILIPPAMPGIVAIALYTFISVWQEYFFALILINSISKRTLPLALVAFRGQYEINWGSLMAATLITTLPLTIVFIILQEKIVSGLTSGAVKE